MFENMRLAFQGIWSHKMRSALTMLGIIIGIASIISIVSMMKGTNEQIKQNLIGNGNNIVEVQLCQDDNPIQLDYQSVPNGVSTISEYTRRNLMDIDHVEGVSLYTQRQYSNDVYYQNQSFSGNVNGIDENYLNVYAYQISVGRPFTTSDYTQRHKVALLDEKASVTMFAGEDPIGKTIEIKGEPFQVVGIVAASSKSTKVINSYSDYHMYADNGSSGTVMIPNTAWPIVYQFDEPQNAALRADTTDNMTQVGETASEIINASFPTLDTSEACYDSPSIKQAAQQLQDLSDSSGKQLIWIAGISLIVGAIGVMNIMLVSVTGSGPEKGTGRKARCDFGPVSDRGICTDLYWRFDWCNQRSGSGKDYQPADRNADGNQHSRHAAGGAAVHCDWRHFRCDSGCKSGKSQSDRCTAQRLMVQ